jgi:hypothetical protein
MLPENIKKPRDVAFYQGELMESEIVVKTDDWAADIE